MSCGAKSAANPEANRELQGASLPGSHPEISEEGKFRGRGRRADDLPAGHSGELENSLAKPEDDGHPEPKFQRATENSMAKWEIWEENGCPKLAMRRPG